MPFPEEMISTDADLRQHVERFCAQPMGMVPEQQLVMALLDAWAPFRYIHEEDAAATRECMDLLTSLELRPAVRQWYQDWGKHEMNPAAAEFRARLSRLVGESL